MKRSPSEYASYARDRADLQVLKKLTSDLYGLEVFVLSETDVSQSSLREAEKDLSALKSDLTALIAQVTAAKKKVSTALSIIKERSSAKKSVSRKKQLQLPHTDP